MEDLREVCVGDVLRARDARAARQRALLEAHRAPLISLTMNIAGPVKRDAWIERAFFEGVRRVEDALEVHRVPVCARERTIACTGCEQLWAAEAPAAEMKAWMCALEERDAIGRLFDIDVLDAEGAHLTRGGERPCLICGGPARACARARAHSVAALQSRTHEIIRAYFEEARAVRIGMCAERALLFEALVTPKPGLVDRENSGAHQDMDIFSFAASAAALRGWFEDCARTGMRMKDAPAEETFERLRADGLRAEREMRAAADGANTHKGALFSMGLLCCAAAAAGERATADVILDCAGVLAAPSLRSLEEMRPEDARTAGERQYIASGRTGVRGEAAAGFPSVRRAALPALRRALAAGKSVNDAGLCALAALMAQVEDSNVLRRGGENALRKLQRRAARLKCGAPEPRALRRMNADFIRENISPGGSADLLAAAFFLHFLEAQTDREGEAPCPQS